MGVAEEMRMAEEMRVAEELGLEGFLGLDWYLPAWNLSWFPKVQAVGLRLSERE